MAEFCTLYQPLRLWMVNKLEGIPGIFCSDFQAFIFRPVVFIHVPDLQFQVLSNPYLNSTIDAIDKVALLWSQIRRPGSRFYESWSSSFENVARNLRHSRQNLSSAFKSFDTCLDVTFLKVDSDLREFAGISDTVEVIWRAQYCADLRIFIPHIQCLGTFPSHF